MRSLKKPIWVIVLVLGVILALSGAYFFWQTRCDKTKIDHGPATSPRRAKDLNRVLESESGASAVPTFAATPMPRNRIIASANWKTYTDVHAGFSLRYPPSITAVYTDPAVPLPYPIDSLMMSIYSQKVVSLGTESQYANNRDYALTEMESLHSGRFGQDYDFVIPASRHVIRVGNVYGKSYVVFGRLWNCDVIFQRTLRFYLEGFQIEISLYGPTAEIVDSIPQYFKDFHGNPIGGYSIQAGVCWRTDSRYAISSQDALYALLDDRKASTQAQGWYDLFDGIIDTINFTPVSD